MPGDAMPGNPLLARLDAAFDALAAVLVQVTIPKERETLWVEGSVSLGYFSEQCVADDDAGTVTYFYHPGLFAGINGFDGFCVGFGARITLPDTPRGQQIRDRLPRWILDAMKKQEAASHAPPQAER